MFHKVKYSLVAIMMVLTLFGGVAMAAGVQISVAFFTTQVLFQWPRKGIT
jgi:hypothetical protein